jgi:hypothetical protein
MAEFSGPEWCARFPGSRSIADLHPDWRGKVLAFISALERGGARVDVQATLRPPERAYLMHWCWMIANLSQSPVAVPAMDGLGIDWTHDGNARRARAAAEAMIEQFELQFLPSLKSRHIFGRAIDMTIAWDGGLSVRDFDGNLHYVLSEPRNGTNPELAKIGATYGVIKLATDPPHWSDDGH